jgi:putative ATPase
MMNNIFQDKQKDDTPLSTRLTPETLESFYGQEKIVGKNGILRKLMEKDSVVSAIFFGPPGCGKTALARIIASHTKRDFIRLNAVTARIEDLRNAITRSEKNKQVGIGTIVFIDEIHRFNKMQQDGLLPSLEEGTITLIGTTTKNPYFSLIPPLRSRVLLFEFERLSSETLKNILHQAQRSLSIEIDEDAACYLVEFANGDARRMLNLLQTAITVSNQRVTMKVIENLITKQTILYDRDEDYHFDVISAFIKSIRGSDPDAALYWLALMLEAGEDPLYIARRLIVLASEDIGLTDSLSLVLAETAYDAVDRLGMPEARIILSHVTIYLSLQPKSNSSYTAIEKALEYVKHHNTIDVPPYLRASHPANKLYKYPHDYPLHYVDQDYLGKTLRFYTPDEKPLGHEKDIKRRFDYLIQLRKPRET